MGDQERVNEVKVLARSPGRYPILVVELASGELRTFYYETGYDPDLTKPVSEDWLRENALGRHSFIALEPPRELPLMELKDFVGRELLGS